MGAEAKSGDAGVIGDAINDQSVERAGVGAMQAKPSIIAG